jgi:hypothetical protein
MEWNDEYIALNLAFVYEPLDDSADATNINVNA